MMLISLVRVIRILGLHNREVLMAPRPPFMGAGGLVLAMSRRSFITHSQVFS